MIRIKHKRFLSTVTPDRICQKINKLHIPWIYTFLACIHTLTVISGPMILTSIITSSCYFITRCVALAMTLAWYTLFVNNVIPVTTNWNTSSSSSSSSSSSLSSSSSSFHQWYKTITLLRTITNDSSMPLESSYTNWLLYT